MNLNEKTINEIDMNCVGFFYSEACEKIAKNYYSKQKDFFVEISFCDVDKDSLLGDKDRDSYNYIIRMRVAICGDEYEHLAFIPLFTKDEERVKKLVDMMQNNLEHAVGLKSQKDEIRENINTNYNRFN